MNNDRQTRSFLMRRFKETGIFPETRHGQNFLIDLNLVELLVRTAAIGPDDVVLEIGTGTGSLTAMMAPQASAVITVEIDGKLFQLASEELIDFNNVTMLKQDALKNKNHFHPKVLATIDEKLREVPGRRLKLAANLPYNVATPILSNLLTIEHIPGSMTATIQRELAERMIAKPNTKDYSSLSIWMQSLCDIEIVRIMPPDVFWPRPKVHSAIVHIVPNAEKRARIPDLAFFKEFVRSMFFHRRKFLRSVILSAYKGRLDKPTVDAVMGEMNLGPDARAEQLNLERMLALCENLRARLE